MQSTLKISIATLGLSGILSLAIGKQVDAHSLSFNYFGEDIEDSSNSLSARNWPELGVQGLSPMWLNHGTPDGTGHGNWPDELETRPSDETWVPPSWAGEVLSSSLWMLEGINSEPQHGRHHRIYSQAAFAYDLDSGEVLVSYAADDRLPVASITKLVSGLTVSAEKVDLNRPLCLDGASRPSWPGALTRLEKNLCTRGWDLLGAAMVRSDNGAAIALADVAQLPYAPFVLRMNDVAQDLGMSSSTFTDPTGVEDTNLSTARDITRLVVAAAFDENVSTAASSSYWDVQDLDGSLVRRLGSTHRLHRRSDVQVLAAKTGYTDTAQHCFTAVLQLENGRRIALTTLGAKRSRYRWRDVDQIISWVRRARY